MKTTVLLVLIVFASSLLAQPVPPPEARQFDFWLGSWDVFGPDGIKQGENRIEKIADGWGLLENWSAEGGGPGKSLNTWIPRKQQWQQFWVGAGGELELAGGLNERGEMVLAGSFIGRDGVARTNRITWTPRPDGTVRQHWEQSKDGGTTWTTVFDGLYRRKT